MIEGPNVRNGPRNEHSIHSKWKSKRMQATYMRRMRNNLAPVVQTSDSAIHRINHYPADSVIDFRNTYPLDSDLSGG